MNSGFPSDFHPAIVKWFETRFGEPTQPQKEGWPLVSEGRNTLILAPTGSGKTLAAFLAGIDRVICDLEAGTGPRAGVEILYISPLKALNYDIERNLSEPLKEIRETAESMGIPLPEIVTAVRTGDTPANERRRMVKKPPHILITTPESLHIMLTSSARKVMETVRYVIVDEIHSLSPNKRGVFLSVLLERLEDICRASPVRIGLSATQKPLSEVAKFLGGFDDSGSARPVEIVDTGVRRQVDLKVVCTVDDLRRPDEGHVWPSIYKRLLDLIRNHKSTIIFANTRRVVERLTLGINELAGEEIVKPHHGSVSASLRRRTEAGLKNGTLRGVVATGTLELGIDMGSVELVCQVESPKEVSRGLQRVGRAGHVHTAVSKGRIIPKTNPDLAEAVSVAEGMLEGDVEAIRVPRNCLDVLAQQIVAMAALDGTHWSDVYRTVRRTYSFNQLSEEAFNLTLQLVSGRYPSKAFKDLRARVSFDRITGRIYPLPGSQRLVISNGGAIPDTGEYGVYLQDANLKLGELDEEFVYESREGDTFSLGTNNWTILKIEADRIIVSHGSRSQSRMPFWRGESVPRGARAGRRMGELLREISEKGEDAENWAIETLPVDTKAAANLVHFVQVQTGAAGESGLPTDKRIVLETFQDEIGQRRMALLSVFGGRIHQSLRIALSALMRKELGVTPETISGDNGILFKLPEGDAPPPYHMIRTLTPERAYALITEDLPNTALFGLRFRQNAARALLLPGAGPGKRTPLWLQRLKARDLLVIAKQFDGFPIVVETFRECLQDYLELDELREILRQVQTGEIEVSVVERQIPSPFASTMLLDFQAVYQYEWDEPKDTARRRSAVTERRLVDELVDGKLNRPLDQRVVDDLNNMLQGIGPRHRSRTAEELYELVRRIGDIPAEDAESRTTDPAFVDALLEEGRLVRLTFPDSVHPERLAACDYLDEYLSALSGDQKAIGSILERHTLNRAVVDPAEIAGEYGFPPEIVRSFVESMVKAGSLVEIVDGTTALTAEYVSPENLETLYRRTLAVQKREAKPASPRQFSDFLSRWQHVHPDYRLSGQEGIRTVLRQLEGLSLPYPIWEPDVLGRRITDFRIDSLDMLCQGGEFLWTGGSSDPDRPGTVAFLTREGLSAVFPLIRPDDPAGEPTSKEVDAVTSVLKTRGASFLIDIAMETGLDSRIVHRILWNLIWTGKVTQDRFSTLRVGAPTAGVGGQGPGTKGEVISDQSPVISGESREPGDGYSRLRSRQSYYRARRQVAKSFHRAAEANPGRWTLLSSLMHGEPDVQESLEILARLLLERYGIVTKDLAQRPGEPDVLWGDLYRIYQRMELSGEIERGYFVDGLSGAQFALAEALDILQASISDQTSTVHPQVFLTPNPGPPTPVLLSACDPAYLFSASGPFDTGFGRIPRLPSNYAVILGGLPAVTAELGSGTLRVRDGLNSEELEAAVSALAHLTDSPWPVRAYRKVELSMEGADPAAAAEVAGILRSVGFEGSDDRMEAW